MTQNLSRRALLAAAAGGVLGVAAAARAADRAPMLRLIANENPYGPSPKARQAASAAVNESWKYALGEVQALRAQIAELEGVSPDHVMVTAGSAEALRVAAIAFAREGGEVIAARPTFAFLPAYASALGCKVIEVPLDVSMRHDLSAMAARVTAATRLVYVCNPNNPTGTMINGPALREFIAQVAPSAPVLVDEAYLDLWPDLKDHTAVSRVLAGDRVVVTRTFSKLHGMAGLRVGYAVALPELIEQMESLRITQMSYTGVTAASASLADAEFLAYSRDHIQECLAITEAVLDETGHAYAPSRGNFIYFDTGAGKGEFMSAMRSAGILTGLSWADYPTWARVSMGRVEDMQAFATAMRAWSQGQS